MSVVITPTALMPPRRRPFRRAVLRGLAITLPPVLTIVTFVWVWNTIQTYVLLPVKDGAREALLWRVWDVRETTADPAPATLTNDGRAYTRLENGQYVPTDVYQRVLSDPQTHPMPSTASSLFRRYVEVVYLQDYYVIPIFLCGFVLVLYLLGKFLAARVAQLVEWAIHRMPLVRNVYGSVKQVIEFMFHQNQIRYQRVVAIEYPRKGVWSVGFVTGEGVMQINETMHQPCVTVVLPASPVPMSGYAVTVPAEAAHDLNMTVDEAFQFIISCGVIVPPHQVPHASTSPVAVIGPDVRHAGIVTAE